MRAVCVHCGTPHILDLAKIADQRRVQFRCSNCGKPTILDLPKSPSSTVVLSPMPDFAASPSAADPGAPFANRDSGLALPPDRSIKLSVVAGPAKGFVYELRKPRVVLGRGSEPAGLSSPDMLINDPEVSRWHCAVEVKGEIVRLRDLDSTNGTYFEQERVRAAELSNYAEFRIGSTVVQLIIAPK